MNDERDLHKAYLRLRAIIPGALNTNYAPSPEEVWAHTEESARKLVETNQRLLEHMRWFCSRVQAGEVRSKNTYERFMRELQRSDR